MGNAECAYCGQPLGSGESVCRSCGWPTAASAARTEPVALGEPEPLVRVHDATSPATPLPATRPAPPQSTTDVLRVTSPTQAVWGASSTLVMVIAIILLVVGGIVFLVLAALGG